MNKTQWCLVLLMAAVPPGAAYLVSGLGHFVTFATFCGVLGVEIAAIGLYYDDDGRAKPW